MALALYRTYRPGSLAEVIGQEHVTEPLARALAAGRIHHAYLFSGPRGCGKTSTARILARSLNCEQGPTPNPCGICRSCVELAPNGPGSIDVVELDAATHRGIDDARDLRERAIYAPAASRYKVYIIDEAHQLTNEAANALLKLIEEPPAHLRFIFATTEPDKIIPTIRSRTFHYGFRLVPARTLAAHLATVCAAEGIPAEASALGVVARAGQGSVRDSLSVLGQLLAGAGAQGLTYADAVSALGLTDAALIDAFVEALASGSAAAMFGVVDRVISGGHDPRRFVTDVLDRLRDLIILRADPEALASGLVEVPDDEGERMTSQAQSMGLAELSRAADLVSAGLGELKGATAPRLQLELLCARLALPSPAEDAGGLLARIERLERGVVTSSSNAAGDERPAAAAARVPAVPPRTSAVQAASEAPAAREGAGEEAPRSGDASARRPVAPDAPEGAQAAGRTPPPRPRLRTTAASQHQVTSVGADGAAGPGKATTGPEGSDAAAPMGGEGGDPEVAERSRGRGGEESLAGVQRAAAAGHRAAGERPAPARPDVPAEPAVPAAPVVPSKPAAPAGGPTPGNDDAALGRIRAAWEQVLGALAAESRVAWTAFHDAAALSVANGSLAVAVAGAGNLRAIAQRGHDERLRQALIDVLGLDLQIDVVHDPGAAQAGSSVASQGGPATSPASAGSLGRAERQSPTAPSGQAASPTDPDGSDHGSPEQGPDGVPAAGAATSSPSPGTAVGPASSGAALVRGAAAPGARDVEHADEPSEDDPDLSAVDGLALVTRALGARTIGEIDHT